MTIYPGDKKIDEYFTLFKRFLKEEGKYKPVINYLFCNGKRSKKQFYGGVKEMYNSFVCSYDFGDILHITYALGESYRTLGHEYWETFISPLSEKWREYFHKNMNLK